MNKEQLALIHDHIHDRELARARYDKTGTDDTAVWLGLCTEMVANHTLTLLAEVERLQSALDACQQVADPPISDTSLNAALAAAYPYQDSSTGGGNELPRTPEEIEQARVIAAKYGMT